MTIDNKEITYQAVQRICAGLLFAALILLVLIKHVVPALLAGLLAYVITNKIRTIFLRKGWAHRRGCNLAAGIIMVVISALIVACVSGSVAYALAGESPAAMFYKLSDTLQQAKSMLPPSVATLMPDSVIAMEELVSRSFRSHATQLASLGTHFAHGLVLVVVGWITGVLVALRRINMATSRQPFHATWLRMWAGLGRVFQAVVFAQCKIAFINAVLTGIFLLVFMPLFGFHIPFAKTLTLVTFVCGLMPVVGNLVSNTLITVISLGVHFEAAMAALLFLIVIHKLEYFLNAKIQGNALGAQVWELLIILFVMEFIFGPAGMVFAPVLYAFSKTELLHYGWLGEIEVPSAPHHPGIAVTASPAPSAADTSVQAPERTSRRPARSNQPSGRKDEQRFHGTTRFLRKKPSQRKPRSPGKDDRGQE